jgi:hypothetical protein
MIVFLMLGINSMRNEHEKKRCSNENRKNHEANSR